jgi:hypothetical protein
MDPWSSNVAGVIGTNAGAFGAGVLQLTLLPQAVLSSGSP